MGGVYLILNLLNGRYYIGSTNDLIVRKKRHFHNLKNNKHINNYLQNDFNKCGENNFIFSIIDTEDNRDVSLNIEENILSILYDNQQFCYNLCPSATVKKAATPESRKKMSDSSKRCWENKDWRQNQIDKRTGKKAWNKGKKMPYKPRPCMKGRPARLHPSSRTYEVKVMSPEGIVYGPIVCLQDFCKEHNLHRKYFSLVIRGKLAKHKGWILLPDDFQEVVDRGMVQSQYAATAGGCKGNPY